jgi:beta-lactamase class D
MISRLALLSAALLALAAPAHARTLCTLVADLEGATLVEQGDCRTRVTPASIFKIPLAVIGFDAGVLQDAHAPVLNQQTGDPDWGGENWRKPVDPAAWMKYSVVWYSQRITRALGAARLTEAMTRYGFGAADFSGDPGKNNGLERAWLTSSLKVSPAEQIAFLRKLVKRDLPVSAHALDQTHRIIETTPAPDGWTVKGKTGSAYPRNPDGELDPSRAWGWYIGWAEKNGRTLLIARLDQDEKLDPVSSGLRVRAALLRALPTLAAGR